MGEDIQVTKEEQEGGWLFRVVLTSADGSATEHRVTLKEADFSRLTAGKAAPEWLVEQSFRFLLKREPKETILREFDLPVISRYFPEYEEEIQRLLGS